jgi:hypothetical protein
VPVQTSQRRRRPLRFDLEAAVKGEGTSGRIRRIFQGPALLDTLVAILFASVEVLIVVAGVHGLDIVSTVGVALVVLAANVVIAVYIAEHHPEVLADRRHFFLFQVITAFAIALAKFVIVVGWPGIVFPLGIFSIGFAVAFGHRFAAFYTVLVALVIGFVQGLEDFGHAAARGLPAEIGLDLPLALTLACGALTAVFALPRVQRRAKVIQAGLWSGAVLAGMVLVTYYLLPGRDALVEVVRTDSRQLGLRVALGFLNGLLTGYFTVEFGLRIVEALFDVVTDLKLQEWADLDQPILKKFAIEAPGTFHHSQMVATIAEAAGEAVGANPLLCRVGAYFHDIGKMAKPEYYIENTTSGVTKHVGLTPTMSTLIIIAHVKDGIEIAEEIGLPPRVIDCIPEHHGTSAVEYFYAEAVRQAEEQLRAEAAARGDGGDAAAAPVDPQSLVSKDDFRYPGPKPQSRETAILMICDSVEATSRLLAEPNASRIEALVHEVVMRRLTEGQFDECGITLRELKRVEEAIVRVLLGVFHGRIRYPRLGPPPDARARNGAREGRADAATGTSGRAFAGGGSPQQTGALPLTPPPPTAATPASAPPNRPS